MGGAGRKRFLKSFSWRILIPRFVALWQNQLAEARRAGANARNPGRLSYNNLFAHYASAALSDSDFVICNDPAQIEMELGTGTQIVPSVELRGQIRRILESCQSGVPTCVGMLKSQLEPPLSNDALAWLLKKGLFTFHRAASKQSLQRIQVDAKLDTKDAMAPFARKSMW